MSGPFTSTSLCWSLSPTGLPKRRLVSARGVTGSLTGRVSVLGRRPAHTDRQTQVPKFLIFVLKLELYHWPKVLPVVFLEGTSSLASFFFFF